MHTSRLTAMRTHTHSIRVLEQQEASMHEAELLTARERDHYFEQLVATVPSMATEPHPPQASPPQQVHRQVVPPPMQPGSAAAGTPGTQQPCAYPNAESYFVEQATGLVTPITTPAAVPLPIHYAGGMPAMGSAPGTAPWRPLGQMPPGSNPLTVTGLYGTDPPTPAMQTAAGTPQGVPSQYSIATPPVPQGMGCAGVSVRPPNPIDPLQVRDSWADNLSSRRSLGPQTSAPSVGTQSPPGFSHVTAPPGFAYGCGATPSIAPGTPGYPRGDGPPGYPHGGGPPGPGPGTPAHGHGHHHPEEFGGKVKASAAKLPRLELKGVDASRLMLKVQNWVWLCSNALNTWGVQAVQIWQAAVAHADREHANWCSLTPAQRVLRYNTNYQQYNSMAPALGLTEAHIKSELLTGKILPDEFVEHAAQVKVSTLAEILEVLYQKYLPSEPTARVEWMLWHK
eukprot:6490889-Amphidinium_carterae.1